MAEQSFFTPARLPPGSPDNWAEQSDRTFGNVFRFAVSGTVTEIGVYGPVSAPPTTWRVKAFDNINTLVAHKLAGYTQATEAWNWVVLDTPLAVTAATDYVFSFYMNGAGNYVVTDGALSTDQTNGDITIAASGGRFVTSSDQFAYPSGVFDGLFFVDVKFTPAGTYDGSATAPILTTLTATGAAGQSGSATASISSTLTAAGAAGRNSVAALSIGGLLAASGSVGGVVPPSQPIGNLRLHSEHLVALYAAHDVGLTNDYEVTATWTA